MRARFKVLLAVGIAVLIAVLLVILLPAVVSVTGMGQAAASTPAVDLGNGTFLYTNKWIGSYETSLFNTSDGDLAIGQYALDEIGTGYYIRTKPKTEAQFDWVPLTYDVSKLTQVKIIGKAYYDEFLTATGATNLWTTGSSYAGLYYSQLPSGSVVRIQSNATKYKGLTSTPNYPQPVRTEIVTTIPPQEPSPELPTHHSIGYDNSSYISEKSGISSYTFSHTCAGSNRLLVFGDGHTSSSDTTVTGVTYNGVALTLVRSDQHQSGDSWRTSIWYLIAPATGSNTVSVTLCGTTSWVYGGVVL